MDILSSRFLLIAMYHYSVKIVESNEERDLVLLKTCGRTSTAMNDGTTQSSRDT